MNYGKDVNQCPSCHTFYRKSATLTQAQSAGKSCDWVAKGDYMTLAEGVGRRGRGAVVVVFLLSDEPLCAGDVITQHH